MKKRIRTQILAAFGAIMTIAILSGCQSTLDHPAATAPSLNEAQFDRIQRNAIRDSRLAKAEAKANAQLNPQSPQPDFKDHGGKLR